MRECITCHVEKDDDQFYGGKYPKNSCKECKKADRKTRWDAKEPEVKKVRNRNQQAKLYNLTPEEYDQMESSQDGLCAICGGPPVRDRRLSIDHDRSCCPRTGSCGGCVRDLLCIKTATLH